MTLFNGFIYKHLRATKKVSRIQIKYGAAARMILESGSAQRDLKQPRFDTGGFHRYFDGSKSNIFCLLNTRTVAWKSRSVFELTTRLSVTKHAGPKLMANAGRDCVEGYSERM